jgi:hypothetical protein
MVRQTTRPRTRTLTPAPDLQTAGIPAPAAIAARAYDLYLARGAQHGNDLDDWLRAERELREADDDAAPAPRVSRRRPSA